MFCRGTQIMDNSRICHCCSMSMVSKTSCSHFACQGSYYATHTLGLNFTIKSWAKSLALMSVIMHGPYLKRTQRLCVIWRHCMSAACPCLNLCHGSQSRFHRRGVNMNVEWTWICFSTCANLKSVRFFKFSVYGHTQTYIHTHASSNAVMLVWGLLRLAPKSIASFLGFLTH